ncbi:hypothetical protein ONZ45_g18041 [Pleurotus djamor]|nr:hypothetical protein ONZ45_g18041 [Pleurotus djamor]
MKFLPLLLTLCSLTPYYAEAARRTFPHNRRAKPAAPGAEANTTFVAAPNCFPSLGFQMPQSTPKSLTNWWCDPASEYAFLGFSYEVTACQSSSQLKKEFLDIRTRFKSRYVRLYGACDRKGFYDDVVDAAWDSGLGVHALIWFGFNGDDVWKKRRDTLLGALHANPKAKYVTRVLQFGSEPLFDWVLSPDDLAKQVTQAKANLSSLGIPVTVSEMAYGYQEHGGAQNVLDATDSINIHMLPFFSQKASTAKQAWPLVMSDLQWFTDHGKGKKMYLDENGWPSVTSEGVQPNSPNAVSDIPNERDYYTLLDNHCQDLKAMAGGGVGQSLSQLKREFLDIRNHFNSRYIRLYGFCDNDGFYDDIVEAAWESGLGVHALIWFGFNLDDVWIGRRDVLLAALHANPKAKFVTRVLQFGSEPLFDGVLPHAELAHQVTLAKANLTSLHIPVTVSELAFGYQERGGAQDVLDAIDSINIHMLPFFSQKASTAKNAWPLVQTDLQWFIDHGKGKKMYFDENGWPSVTSAGVQPNSPDAVADIPNEHGSYIETGTLRYGQTVNNDYGEIVEWRHWGCVTAAILGSLASVQLERVNGFNSLKPVDKNRVKRAITLRRVDASDIPMSAKAASAPLVIDLTQKKRKSAPEPGPSTAQVSSQAIDTVEDDGGIDQDNDDFGDELYCTMQTNVVGIQYYKGLVGSGEEALLVREANNKYDGNAIQVKNISHQQVGHLPRLIAAKLAPLLDRGLVTAEAIIREGNLGGGKAYNLPLTLLIYGASDRRDFLEPQLIWATPGQRGFPQRNQPSGHSSVASSQPTSSQRTSSQAVPQPSASQRAQQTPAQLEAVRRQQEALQKAAELKQMLQSLEKVDDEGRRASLLDSLCSVEDILELPLHPSPPGIEAGNLTVNLLRHQAYSGVFNASTPFYRRQILILQFNSGNFVSKLMARCVMMRLFGSIALISQPKGYYYNLATKSPQPLNSPPVLGRGGLCADSMGLGKTLTMLALIVATQNDVPKAFSNSTLIVVPLSVMSNWEKQLDDHVTPGTLKTCVYYGSGRSMTSRELAQHDVVITTYQVVTGEAGDVAGGSAPSKKKAKKDRSLFDVKWKVRRFPVEDDSSV